MAVQTISLSVQRQQNGGLSEQRGVVRLTDRAIPLTRTASHLLRDSPTSVLDPPRGAGLLADHDLLQELNRFVEAFGDAHQRIFVFDRERAVVAGDAQFAD